MGKVRLAIPDDGTMMKSLAAEEEGWFRGVDFDWRDCTDSWIVYEDKFGKLIGMIQVVPSKPVGHIEFLVVRKRVSKRTRALVARDLTDAAQSLLRQAGSSVACGTIPLRMKGYLDVATHRGWKVWNEVSFLLKGL